MLAESGRSAEAITLRRQAVTLREQSLKRGASKLGPDHPDTVKSRTGLINAYESLGRWADAEPRRRDALAARRQTARPDSPLLAGEAAELGHNLLSQKKGPRLSRRHKCLAIRGQAAPDDSAGYDAMSLLGTALLGQGRYTEAEPLIVPGFEGMTERQAKIAMPDRSRLREAAERVVRLYEDWGKAEQATAWKANCACPICPPTSSPGRERADARIDFQAFMMDLEYPPNRSGCTRMPTAEGVPPSCPSRPITIRQPSSSVSDLMSGVH